MINIANDNEIDEVCSLAKVYETEYSSHVTVNVDHAKTQYKRFVESGIGIVFVLKHEGVIVGGIAGLKYPDIHSGKTIAVETFWFVDKAHRGDGLKLLRVFEKWASDSGCDKIALIHLADSYPDILEKLYTRKGYSLAEKHYVKEIQP